VKFLQVIGLISHQAKFITGIEYLILVDTTMVALGTSKQTKKQFSIS